MLYFFTFPIPPTLNQQIAEARSNRYKSAATKLEWTSRIALLASVQYKEQITLGIIQQPLSKVKLEFFWHYTSTKSDPDNMAAASKYLMDGLVMGGVLVDDSLKYIQSPVIHHYQKCIKKIKARQKMQPYVELKILSV